MTRVPRKLSGNRAVFGRVLVLTQYCGWTLAFCCMSLSFIRFVLSAVPSAPAPAGGYWAVSKLCLLGVLPCLPPAPTGTRCGLCAGVGWLGVGCTHAPLADAARGFAKGRFRLYAHVSGMNFRCSARLLALGIIGLFSLALSICIS